MLENAGRGDIVFTHTESGHDQREVPLGFTDAPAEEGADAAGGDTGMSDAAESAAGRRTTKPGSVALARGRGPGGATTGAVAVVTVTLSLVTGTTRGLLWAHQLRS